ncbi:MAG TPA: glutamate-5-semialdehyde dehydrogenase [Clostridiales bacterium]|nr:glutamate-5-semialdehyde dehydrogenase [Clostridiales bacterium]
MNMLESLGKKAKAASRTLANASTEIKNSALLNIAQMLRENADRIISANEIDLKNGKESGLSNALLDRLALNETRINDMVQGVTDIVALPDPVGRIERGTLLPNGLQLIGIRVPLGVIGIIYEARPNVTCDAAALCIKSGNAVILRGGKEAINSNMAIVEIMRAALEDTGLPPDCIQLVEDTSRESATALMQLSGYLDVLIPRGGAGLIRAVVENSRVPVIETGAGNCHIYVDATADINMAAEIVYNAKCSRPSVCNALETLLVHKDIAEKVLPVIKQKLDQKSTQIRGCKKTCEILGNSVVPVTEEDYKTEFLDYILAVRVVDSIDQAIEHISKYSTGHSEGIITESYQNARRFEREIDAAAVYVNASTRFTDGGQFGFGAEIGISTQKLHARGPMGLSELTSMKYIVRGEGQVR